MLVKGIYNMKLTKLLVKCEMLFVNAGPFTISVATLEKISTYDNNGLKENPNSEGILN